MSAPILLEVQDRIAILTLNRPANGNAFDLDAARMLLDVAWECDNREDVRCVVMTGAGRLFCAGGDIGSFGRETASHVLEQLTGYLGTAISRLARMKKPLISAINGPAAGAGVGLAILSDLAIASEQASFTMAYTAIGLTPDCGTSWLLPRLVGLRAAQDLAITNRRVDSHEAQRLGMVSRVVEHERLMSEALNLAGQLAAGATRAFATTRSLLLSSFGSAFEEHLRTEAMGIVEASRGDEGQEGITAFVSKRKPQFPM